jgi:hypothetical protein
MCTWVVGVSVRWLRHVASIVKAAWHIDDSETLVPWPEDVAIGYFPIDFRKKF